MDETAQADTRQRVTKWIGESQALLGLLPGLLEEIDHARAKVEAAERECVRLRQEITAIQTEKAEAEDALKKLREMLQPVTEVLQKPGAGLKKSPFRPAVKEAEGEAAGQPPRP